LDDKYQCPAARRVLFCFPIELREIPMGCGRTSRGVHSLNFTT
jgi:hypothetical protein